MTEQDKQLIERAKGLGWDQIEDLKEKAESDEAKQELHWMSNHAYHNEEFSAGLL